MPNYVELGAESPLTGGLGVFPDTARIVTGGRERRDAPRELQNRLTLVGGRNVYGEPRLRLVWGWTPMELIYSQKRGHYERRPKYFLKTHRWHVEQWFPAEYYGTPDMWRWQFTTNVDGMEIDLLGPYPARGGYEHVVTVEKGHKPGCLNEYADACPCGGGYIELTPHVCEDLVNRLRVSREITAAERKSAVWSKIQDHYDKPDPIEDAIIDDAMPAFRSKAHAVLENTDMWKGRE